MYSSEMLMGLFILCAVLSSPGQGHCGYIFSQVKNIQTKKIGSSTSWEGIKIHTNESLRQRTMREKRE